MLEENSTPVPLLLLSLFFSMLCQNLSPTMKPLIISVCPVLTPPQLLSTTRSIFQYGIPGTWLPPAAHAIRRHEKRCHSCWQRPCTQTRSSTDSACAHVYVWMLMPADQSSALLDTIAVKQCCTLAGGLLLTLLSSYLLTLLPSHPPTLCLLAQWDHFS